MQSKGLEYLLTRQLILYASLQNHTLASQSWIPGKLQTSAALWCRAATTLAERNKPAEKPLEFFSLYSIIHAWKLNLKHLHQDVPFFTKEAKMHSFALLRNDINK